MTDVGKVRHNNEDSIFVSNEPVGALPNLYIVSDGMGGHNAGEIASSMGIGFFREYIKTAIVENGDILDALACGAHYANDKVFKISLSNHSYRGMGATFSLCVIDKNKLYAVHVGDSRIYLVKNGAIEQISMDHTYVNEMIKAGEITESEARIHPHRNLITRALGTEKSLKIDCITMDVAPGDMAIICSDGLSNMVSGDVMLAVALENAAVSAKCEKLLRIANENGGEDNISVVFVEVSDAQADDSSVSGVSV